MHRRTVIGILSAALVPQAPATPGRQNRALNACRQLLRVETAHWKATNGTLTLWGRARADGTWRQEGRAIPVVIGRNGMRWGRGRHSLPAGAALKQEGDGCSPAGIFRLDAAFGPMRPEDSGARLWPWTQLTAAHAGVDDSRSRHYNRITDSSAVKKDWSSAEDMMPKSGVYRRGIVVRHNWDQLPGGGSCIFLHIRSGPRSPTAGCTAMAESDVIRLLDWLDPAKKPLLVQLPRPEWAVFGPEWGLPGGAATDKAQKTTKNARQLRLKQGN